MSEQSTSAIPEAPQVATLLPPSGNLGASRRALLMGFAAAATPMAPALANALSEAATSPDADAELLLLKPEFDEVFGEWVRQRTKDCLDRREFERLHLAKFGFDRDDAPEVDWKDPEYLAYDRELRRLISEHHSGRSEDDLHLCHWERLNGKLNPLIDKIFSFKASTLDGLRIQTRALIIYHDDIWN